MWIRVCFGQIRDLAVMRALHFLMTTMAISVFCSQCCTPEEGILGRFVLDTETGCTTCVALGPQTMTFDDEASGSLLGNYRLDFADGVYHEGMYELVYLESSVVVVLYPEQASIEHLGLLGSTIQSEYRIGQRAIREQCNGVLDCVWRREG